MFFILYTNVPKKRTNWVSLNNDKDVKRGTTVANRWYWIFKYKRDAIW